MAITKNIVEMMNGTISVESEKGVGTQFTVIVTLRNVQQHELELEYSVDKRRAGQSPRAKAPPPVNPAGVCAAALD